MINGYEKKLCASFLTEQLPRLKKRIHADSIESSIAGSEIIHCGNDRF